MLALEPTFKPLIEYAYVPVPGRWIARSQVLNMCIESDTKEDLVKDTAAAMEALMQSLEKHSDAKAFLMGQLTP